MDDEWISAAEAFALVGKGSPFSAAQAICGRANDGLMIAKAHTLIIGDRRMEDVDVPAEFWWARGHAALEQKWPSGDFETWIDNRVHCRAYGVTFLKSDITSMLPASGADRNQPRRAGKGNYASAGRCVEELQQQLHCTKKEAGEHIVRFCTAGLVDAKCASYWCEVTDIFGHKEETFENVAIPAWFWENCAHGPDAILDWQGGTFAGRGKVGAHMHKVRIKGAEFDIGGIIDLEMMVRAQDMEDVAPTGVQRETRSSAPVNSSRGGRPKSESWANWIAELVSTIHDEGVPDGSGAEGQDALIGRIEERLGARDLEGPSRSTVQPAVRAALLRLRSAGN